MNMGNLFLVFLILKLTGVITWSWWWVTCPLWIMPVLFVVLCLFTVVFALVVLLIAAIAGR